MDLIAKGFFLCLGGMILRTFSGSTSILALLNTAVLVGIGMVVYTHFKNQKSGIKDQSSCIMDQGSRIKGEKEKRDRQE